MKEGLAVYKKAFSRRLAAYSAIAVLVLVSCAYFFGWSVETQSSQDWKSRIASSYDMSSYERWEQQPAFINYSRWLGRGFNVVIAQPELTYETAAVRDFSGQTLLHWLFSTDDQQTVSLFMLQTEKPDLSEPVVELRHGFQTATWTKDGVEYLMIGEDGFETIGAAARKISGS
jgi:hypothetical protein